LRNSTQLVEIPQDFEQLNKKQDEGEKIETKQKLLLTK